jgi:hypothetical protein
MAVIGFTANAAANVKAGQAGLRGKTPQIRQMRVRWNR